MKIIEVSRSSNFGKDSESSFVNKVADQLQRFTYAEKNLINSISNSMKLHKFEAEKSQGFLGKMLSVFSGTVDSDMIEIDGMRLFQCFKFSKTQVPNRFNVGSSYLVEVSELSKMLEEIKAGSIYSENY